jgi:ATP-dependent Clp protease ATP-binding subunit ClpB
LTNGLKEKPRSIILFDEAEKADKSIWQSLLPLFDEGIVREADGTQYDATGCILLATSNKGYAEAIESLNVWERNWEDVRDEVQGMVWEAMGSYFSPEFLGRFGRENVIYFNHFSKGNYKDLLDLQIGNLIAEMKGRGIEVSFSNKDATVELLSELAWVDRREGARPVRRLVTSNFRDAIIAARGDDPERTRFQFDCLSGSGEILLGPN